MNTAANAETVVIPTTLEVTLQRCAEARQAFTEADHAVWAEIQRKSKVTG